jgi:hypothetical protein
MATFTAIYDACTLYPAPLRDLLMHLPRAELSPMITASDLCHRHPDRITRWLLVAPA